MGSFRNLSRTDDTAVYGNITVTTSASEAKVGATTLENRDFVVIQATGNGVYYGFNSSVTVSTGIRLFKNQILKISVGDNIGLYLISASGSIDVRIQELS